MKIRKAGATSTILQIFVRDSSSTTGGGLTGLTNASASLTAYYHRDTDTTATVISLVTMTVGTFTSSGFKEIDATNMPGWYQFCPPNAAMAAGATSVAFHFKGAANMAPDPIEVRLVGYDPDDAVRLGLTALPNAAAAANGGLPILGTNAFAISFTAGLTVSNASGDALTLSSSGGNGNGVTIAGNGSGQGIKTTAGATGHGLYILGGATSGSAARVESFGPAAMGLHILGGGTGAGIQLDGGATAPGLKVNGGATSGDGIDIVTTSGDGLSILPTAGNGIVVTANGTSKHGAVITGGTGGTSDGVKAVAGTGGVDIRANLTGNITGNLSGSAGSVSGAVGSVTGNVGGNVTGSVGSVVATVAANLTQILGTALTETAGQIAAAFKQFFNIGSPTGTVNLIPAVTTVGSVTGAVGSVTARVTANTDQLAGQTVTAAAGVTFPTSVASPTNITAGTITTATNLTNAPTAGDFTAAMKTSLNAATPASVVGAVGSVTGNVGGNVNGNVVGSVGSVTAAVTVGTNNDKTGYALSAGGVQAIWDALTSALTTAGSIGKLLASLPGAIWDVVLSGHLTAGTTGAALNSAGSAGDPWATALPGAYASGSAGNILGNRLDVAVSTRLATSGYTAPDNADIVLIKAKTDNLPASPAATGAAMTLTSAYDAAKTAAQVSDIPTAVQNADALLKRDMSAVTGEAARSPLNALRFLRNKWTLVSTLLTVTKEDDTATAWTATVGTTAGVNPVTSTDPT